jgi:hypothetical protein
VTLYQTRKAAAILCSIFAVLSGILFLRLDWASRIEFDITGFMWALSNAGRLTVLVLFLVFTGVAIAFWIQAYLERG